MQRLRTVTLLDVSTVAGHHAMPAALLFYFLQVARLKDQHKEEIKRLYTDLEDESTSRSSMDRRLVELRREVRFLGLT